MMTNVPNNGMKLIIACVRSGKLRRHFQRLRARSVIVLAGTVFIGALLQGCVTSQLPLLDDSVPVADSSFMGHYRYEYNGQTANVDVYLKDYKEFLVAENGRLRFISVLNQWDPSTKTLIGEAREVGKRDYVYFLVRQTQNGAELNFIPCPVQCQVRTLHDLSNLTSYGSNFQGEGNLTATKTGNL